MNIASIIRNTCKTKSNRIAIINEEESITYGEMWERINEVSNYFIGKNVTAGDRVAIILPNGKENIINHIATLNIGAISIPIKYDYRQYELKTIFENSRPKVIVTDYVWAKENTKCIEKIPYKGEIIYATEKRRQTRIRNIETSKLKGRSVASINYSCYEGGRLKGASLTHANHIYAAIGYIRHLRLNKEDVFLVILPMPNVFTLSGCINTSLIMGSSMVISKRISPKAILGSIEKYKVSVLTGIPAIYQLICRYRKIETYDISSLRICITGGSFMKRGIQERFSNILKTPIIQGYGLTETMPVVCNRPDKSNRYGSLGIAGRKDIIYKIVNNKNEEVKNGIRGEIIIKSPTTMKEYYGLECETRKIIKKGWLYTGDIGFVDREGYLHFHGLKKDIFNVDGNNIDPREIENSILWHNDVKDVRVYLKEHETSDDIIGSTSICAEVKVKYDRKLSVRELRTFLMDKIAYYKIPDEFKLLKEKKSQADRSYK